MAQLLVLGASNGRSGAPYVGEVGELQHLVELRRATGRVGQELVCDIQQQFGELALVVVDFHASILAKGYHKDRNAPIAALSADKEVAGGCGGDEISGVVRLGRGRRRSARGSGERSRGLCG